MVQPVLRLTPRWRAMLRHGSLSCPCDALVRRRNVRGQKAPCGDGTLAVRTAAQDPSARLPGTLAATGRISALAPARLRGPRRPEAGSTTDDPGEPTGPRVPGPTRQLACAPVPEAAVAGTGDPIKDPSRRRAPCRRSSGRPLTRRTGCPPGAGRPGRSRPEVPNPARPIPAGPNPAGPVDIAGHRRSRRSRMRWLPEFIVSVGFAKHTCRARPRPVRQGR